MLTGVGTDILLIERMRCQITSAAFMSRVFTADEMNVGRWRADPATYYAKVFAAKEAVFKCFGIPPTSWGPGSISRSRTARRRNRKLRLERVDGRARPEHGGWIR